MLLVSQRQRNEIRLQLIWCSKWSFSRPSSLNLWVAESEERDQLLLSGDQYRTSRTGNSVTRNKNHASSTRCTTLTLVAASPWWSLAACSRHGYKLAPKLSALSGPIHSFCECRPVLSEEIRFCQSDTEPTALSRDSRSSWLSAVVAMMLLRFFAFAMLRNWARDCAVLLLDLLSLKLQRCAVRLSDMRWLERPTLDRDCNWEEFQGRMKFTDFLRFFLVLLHVVMRWPSWVVNPFDFRASDEGQDCGEIHLGFIALSSSLTITRRLACLAAKPRRSQSQPPSLIQRILPKEPLTSLSETTPYRTGLNKRL